MNATRGGTFRWLKIIPTTSAMVKMIKMSVNNANTTEILLQILLM
jgi:hypothetical protein